MKNSRRRFLQIAGVSALGLGAKPVLNAFALGGGKGYHVASGEDALTAEQWAMVIDTRKLQTAEAVEPIIEACNKIHNIPTAIDNKNHEVKWIWEDHYHHVFPDKTNKFLDEAVEHKPFLLLCNHCENPPCCRVCPTKATFKRESDGIVLMDFHRCIGCRFCMAACPFGARSFNFRDPRPFIEANNKEFPTRMKGVVEKCNFCAERLAIGKMPACVEASNGAIAFGDLYDEHSVVRELLKENYTIRRKQTLGTEPSVYYIV
ncbi:MAG: 4Fe-4S dicluster domain-containing protein [Desulfosarcina sp.]|nr:4Fe-4S dicluster domain-containing protein [Desulfosarcina sp.]MBC2744080.1 4Fe-4S dicluster domain-containing protein [Desulfosarcina sp.]MBC2766989.1 4Fe-4S dicluster domain-containing protein [Desulfosarcina sp.]